MSETFSQRSTPSKSTTDMELAKLMAEVYSMPEGLAKTQLIRRMKHNQRQQLGLPKRQSVLGVSFCFYDLFYFIFFKV